MAIFDTILRMLPFCGPPGPADLGIDTEAEDDNPPLNIWTKLPADVLEGIVGRLSVEDILRLRMVNKFFFRLTLQAAVWERILLKLKQCKILVPSLSVHRSLQNRGRAPPVEATNFDVEYLVLKAVLADDNIRRLAPEYLGENQLQTSGPVCEMKLVPGGDVLVVSGLDTEKDQYHWSIFHLHDRRLLSYSFLPVKAYDIKANLVRVQGVEGIQVIYKQSEDDPDSDATLTTCYVVFVPLATPDKHAVLLRHPLTGLAASYTLVKLPTGAPICAFYDASKVQFIYDFAQPILFTLNLPPVIAPGVIVSNCKTEGIYILPRPRLALVVRTGYCNEGFQIAGVQLFNLPQIEDSFLAAHSMKSNYGDRHLFAAQLVTEPWKWFVDIQIADPPDPETSLQVVHVPPITIYGTLEDSNGTRYFAHHTIWPFFSEGQWKCKAQYVSELRMGPHRNYFIPGLQRSLLYGAPPKGPEPYDEPLNVGTYINPPIHSSDKNITGPPFPFDAPRYPLPPVSYCPLLHPDRFRHRGILPQEGPPVIAWDELTGRLCISSGERPGILVLDHAEADRFPRTFVGQRGQLETLSAPPIVSN
ncbi:hypothetical protein AAF712_011653 [Marasmius tenuissimus]|uniref:F-box domain-containing protein n=1 Tax=Marasmius tenuissimus TaxID=585030 RepID=A0ABR2ZJK8_9AGAR